MENAKTDKTTITIRLTKDLKNLIERKASQLGITPSEYLRQTVMGAREDYTRLGSGKDQINKSLAPSDELGEMISEAEFKALVEKANKNMTENIKARTEFHQYKSGIH